MGRRKRKKRTNDEIGFHERLFFKTGSKLLLGVLMVVIVLTLAQCTIEKPEAPEWTTSLTIPLVNRTFPMEELIEKIDQEEINIDGMGNITFTVNNKELDSIYIDASYMTTDDLSQTMFQSLGIQASLKAAIPPDTLEFSQNVELAESNRLDSADISDGNLELTLDNQTNVPAILEIVIPDIQQDELPLSVRDTLDSRTQSVLSVSLTDYRLIPADQSVPQGISINVAVIIPGTAPGDSVLVTNIDGFAVDVSLTSMTFSSISGILTDFQMTFDSIDFEIDIPKGFNEIGFPSAGLTLEIDNGFDIPGTIDLQLTGNNDKSLTFTEDITARGDLISATNSYTRSTNLLSPFPDTILVCGTVQLGDDSTAGTVRTADFMTGRMGIVAPLEMIIESSEIETDIESKEIDQTDIDIMTDHVEQLSFVYHIFNHLPVGAGIEVFLGKDSTTLYTEPELAIGPISVAPASVVDSIGVAIDTASTGEQNIILTNDDIGILENDTLYMGTRLVLQETKSRTVKLTVDDFITVVGRFEIDYHFDD
ncbi:MAG: hypothetical protein U9R56_07980 [candidate division Zixibacteria bacterium]|nr:hypothetical protein [candidate division Zixibacteria bacterium]